MAKRKVTKRKTAKRNPWKSFGRSVYEKVMCGLVHFSAKTVNSNTPGAGVRIEAGGCGELPYVAVSTTEGVPYDYTTTGDKGINTTILAQVSAALSDNADDLFEGVVPGEVEMIKAMSKEILPTYSGTGTATVGMRLRQIIVQNSQGEDVAITPLQSAGFSHLLHERLEEKRNEKHHFYHRRGYLCIGGTNPHNVGRYARAMRRPLFFAAPTEKHDLRVAYALHHRGIDLTPPSALLKDYIRWRNWMLAAGGGDVLSDAAKREKEADFIRAVIAAIEERAAAARRQLESAVDELPGQKLLADGVNGLMRALILPGERTTAWKQDFAQELHRRILDTKVKINGVAQTIGVGEYESARWLSIIEEAL